MDLDLNIQIRAVYNKHTMESLDSSEFKIKLSTSPNPIFKIFQGDKPVTKNNLFICQYECESCHRLNVVALNTMARKLNRRHLNCQTCQTEDRKRTNETKFDLVDRLLEDQKQFDDMDDDFKASYFRKHLTKEEFDHLKPKIQSFQHNKFPFRMENFIYFPCVKVSDHPRFYPYLYDVTRDVIEKIQYISFKCDCCSRLFLNRDIYPQKNKLRVLCEGCDFTNQIVKIRSHRNMTGHRVQYQSKNDHKLIKWANEHRLVIEDGPLIEMGSKRFHVSYQFPQIGILVITRDNHGRGNSDNDDTWKVKEQALITYVCDPRNEYTQFLMIYPKDFVEKINYLLKLKNGQ